MGNAVIRARSPVRVAASASAVTVLAAESARAGATVFNDSVAYLYLKFGSTASSTDFTVRVAPGAIYSLPEPAYIGLITGIWSAALAGEAAQVTEVIHG